MCRGRRTKVTLASDPAPLLRAATRSSPELQSDQSIDANVRLPPHTHFQTESHAIGDKGPHTASRRERPFARRVGAIEEVFARLKHSTTCGQERGDLAWT